MCNHKLQKDILHENDKRDKKNYAKYLSTNYILISKVKGTGLENDVSSPTKNKCTDASMCPIFQ